MASAAGDSGQTGTGGAVCSVCASRPWNRAAEVDMKASFVVTRARIQAWPIDQHFQQPPVAAVGARRREQVEREAHRKHERAGEIQPDGRDRVARHEARAGRERAEHAAADPQPRAHLRVVGHDVHGEQGQQPDQVERDAPRERGTLGRHLACDPREQDIEDQRVKPSREDVVRRADQQAQPKEPEEEEPARAEERPRAGAPAAREAIDQAAAQEQPTARAKATGTSSDRGMPRPSTSADQFETGAAAPMTTGASVFATPRAWASNSCHQP